jgi:hypothetical protein
MPVRNSESEELVGFIDLLEPRRHGIRPTLTHTTGLERLEAATSTTTLDILCQRYRTQGGAK